MPAYMMMMLLTPLVALGFVVGGVGTGMLVTARTRQASPTRAAWATWSSGWSVALVVLLIQVAIAFTHLHALVTSGQPLISISVTSN